MKWLYASESFLLLDGRLNCGSIETIQNPLCPLCTLVFLCGEIFCIVLATLHDGNLSFYKPAALK